VDNDNGTNKMEDAGSRAIPSLAMRILKTEPDAIINEDQELERKWRALDESMNKSSIIHMQAEATEGRQSTQFALHLQDPIADQMKFRRHGGMQAPSPYMDRQSQGLSFQGLDAADNVSLGAYNYNNQLTGRSSRSKNSRMSQQRQSRRLPNQGDHSRRSQEPGPNNLVGQIRQLATTLQGTNAKGQINKHGVYINKLQLKEGTFHTPHKSGSGSTYRSANYVSAD